MDVGACSMTASPYSSHQPSPCASYNPSPASSSFASPSSSSYAANRNVDGNSLIPWLKSLSSASSSKLHHLYIPGGSISAPVTPPLSSPSSPSRQIIPDPSWFTGIRIPQGGQSRPTSPTFSFVSSSPFGLKEETSSLGGSRMWTPGQSGTCSPAIAAGLDHTADVPMAEVISDEFAFRSTMKGLVKAWEGETIHEDSGSDDLELTLGSSRTK